MIVPNEQVVTGVVVNHSTGDHGAPRSPRCGCRPGPTSRPPAAALEPLEPSAVDVAEMTTEGVRIDVHGPRRFAATRQAGEEAALRERAHRALREAGLLDGPA